LMVNSGLHAKYYEELSGTREITLSTSRKSFLR
jgi:hypothetical protein